MCGSVSTRSANVAAIAIINAAANEQIKALKGPTQVEMQAEFFKAVAGPDFVVPEVIKTIGEIERRLANASARVAELTQALIVDALKNYSVWTSSVNDLADATVAHDALVAEYDNAVKAYEAQVQSEGATIQ